MYMYMYLQVCMQPLTGLRGEDDIGGSKVVGGGDDIGGVGDVEGDDLTGEGDNTGGGNENSTMKLSSLVDFFC